MQGGSVLDSGIGRMGTATGVAFADRLDKVKLKDGKAWLDGIPIVSAHYVALERFGGAPALVIQHHNAYVRTGLRNAMLREALGTGTSWAGIGLASDNNAVTENTRFLGGAQAGITASGATQNCLIKPITNVTVSAITDGATQVGQGQARFQPADFYNGVPFVWNKLGILLSATTDADGNLVDVIGGSGGAAPYNKPFSVDFRTIGTFDQTWAIAVTAVAQ